MGILILIIIPFRETKTKQQQVLENWRMNVNAVIIALCCLFVMNLEISYAEVRVMSRGETLGEIEKMKIEFKEFRDSTSQDIQLFKLFLDQFFHDEIEGIREHQKRGVRF